MSRELVNRLEKLQLQAARKVRICSFPDCRESTVKNHCVSQALIANFAENGHVRVLTVSPWIEGGLAFRRTGIGNVSTFHGLCNKHDHTIFSPVDKAEVDTRNYRNRILLSYRALLHEKLKKTNKQEAYRTFHQENKGSSNRGVELAALHDVQFDYNLLSVAWYGRELLQEISDPSGGFTFRTIEFPYYEVAGSELFSFEPDVITNMKRSNYNRFQVIDPFADVFVHLVPSRRKQRLTAVLGTHRKDKFILNHFCSYLKSLDPLKALSDLLFLYVCDWICSENFFRNHLEGKEGALVDIYYETATVSATSRNTAYNLFTA